MSDNSDPESEPYTTRATSPGTKLFSSLRERSVHFCDLIESAPVFFIGWFTAFYLLATVSAAFVRPFWLDEIISLHIISMPRLLDIWEALLNAVDGNPPGYYVISRPVYMAFGPATLALRSNAIVGFWVGAVLLFAFVRRRCSTASAAAATMLFANSAAWYWAYEARPYAIVLGLSGVAIVCWQRYTESGPNARYWLAGMTLCIAGLVSTHYYGLMVVASLGVGEATRWATRKSPDWKVATCIAFGSSILALWLPILRSVSENVSLNSERPEFYSRPSLEALATAYVQLLHPLSLFLVVIAFILIVVVVRSITSVERAAARPPSIPPAELALAIALSAIPIFVFVAALLATGAFHVRYTLPAALGMAALLGYLLDCVLRRNAVLEWFLVGALFLKLAATGLFMGLAASRGPESAFRSHPLLLEQSSRSERIVIAEGLYFPPLWFYADAEFRKRLFYLTDLPTAQQTTDTTNEIIMDRLRPLAPESVIEVQEFIADGQSFLLYYTSRSPSSVMEALLKRGCSLRIKTKLSDEVLFECACPH